MLPGLDANPLRRDWLKQFRRAMSNGGAALARGYLGATAIGSSLMTAATAAAARTLVDGSVPVFSAYQTGTAQVFSAGVYNKLTLNAEEIDTASCFDTTNSRFTPNVAGYYVFTGCVVPVSAATLACAVFKNGSLAKYGNGVLTNPTAVTVATPPILMNGTTDYVELWGFSNTTATMTTGTAGCYFGGHLVRAT